MVIRVRDGDDADIRTLGEFMKSNRQLMGIQVSGNWYDAVAKVKGFSVPVEDVIAKGTATYKRMSREAVGRIVNDLARNFEVEKPLDFDKRASIGKEGIDFGVRGTSDLDSMYSNLILRVRHIVERGGDNWEIQQAVADYKKRKSEQGK